MAAPGALSAATGPGLRRPRLDPFRLPPATGAQFGLLAVLTLFGAAYATDLFLGRDAAWIEAYRRCALDADAATATDVALRAHTYLACNDAVGMERFAAAAAAMGVAALAIALLHAAAPRVLIRRRALGPPEPGLYPAAVAEVRALIAETGLRRPPVLLVDPFRALPAGRVFGAFGRHHLKLNIGLLRGTDAAAQQRRRAVVRHELAHLTNRDVEITGLTVAAGRVLLVILAGYLAAVAATAPTVLPQALGQVVLFAALVVLARAAVVRTREHYADVRAADPAGFPPAAFPDPPATSRLRSIRRWALRLHPAADARAAVVADPSRLLRLSPVLPLTVGLTAGLLHPSVELVLENLLGRWPGSTPLVGGLVTALVMAVPLVAAVWRACLAETAGARRPRIWPAAVLLAGGFLLGGYAMPTTGRGWVIVLTTRPATAAVLAVILAAGFALVLAWARGAARAWLGGGDGDRRALRCAQVLGVVLLGTVIGVWYGNLSSGPAPDVAVLALTWLAGVPLGVLAVVAAAAYTVASALRATAVTGRPWRALAPAAAAAGAVAAADLLVSGGVLVGTAEAALRAGRVDYEWAFAVLAIPGSIGAATAFAVLVATARAGSPFAHATVAAAAAVVTLELVAIGRLAVVCPRICMPWNGVGMITQALNAAGAIGATAGLLAGAPVALLLARRGTRPRRPLRRPWVAQLCAALLAGLGVVSVAAAAQSSMYLALAVDDGVVPTAAARSRPDADPAGTVGVVHACRLRNEHTASDPAAVSDHQLAVHAAMAASDSPAVAAFARAAYDIERRGGDGTLARTTAAAAETYCRFLTQLPLPAGPPDILPPGFDGSWTADVTEDGVAPFRMTVTITASAGVGTVAAHATYATLGCTAHWTLTHVAEGAVTVHEFVDTGDCVSTDVRLRLGSDGTLDYAYDPGHGHAQLTRG